MKIVTAANHGYCKIVYNFYKNLERFNRHKDLIIFCLQPESIYYLQSLGVQCEIELLKPTICKQLELDKEALTDKRTFDPGISQIYYKITFAKHEAFYQSVKRFGSAVLMDADIAIFEDFLPDLEKILEQRSIIYRTHYYPFQMNINTGFMAAKNEPAILNHLENILEQLQSYFDPSTCRIDDDIILKCCVENIFTNRSLNQKYEFISDDIHSLNHAAITRLEGEDIINNKSKTFHLTSFTLEEKVTQLKKINQWFTDDFLMPGIEFVQRQK